MDLAALDCMYLQFAMLPGFIQPHGTWCARWLYLTVLSGPYDDMPCGGRLYRWLSHADLWVLAGTVAIEVRGVYVSVLV